MAEYTISAVGTSRDDQNIEDLRRNPDAHASDEGITSSHPQPQNSSTTRRRSISPPSPEPYLPKHNPSSSNIDETNSRTLGPRGSNDHFAESSATTPTDLKIPEDVKQYFLSLPPGRWGLVKERIRNDCGGPSSIAFDGTLASPSSSQSKSSDASNLDFTSARSKYRTPSSRPTKARQIASSQPRSNTAGLSKRRKIPEPEEREYIEISSGDEGDAAEVDDG
ncbi:unnamed protein product [Rhizoctonia solani]|uniref:Uncharacterized protein n=1 Tax=Rhizoctonia solani TaxID=456999 RepID=A0A8H3I254_9AGAM|nr:unnamed protein product [Rhizoctonia solani]